MFCNILHAHVAHVEHQARALRSKAGAFHAIGMKEHADFLFKLADDLSQSVVELREAHAKELDKQFQASQGIFDKTVSVLIEQLQEDPKAPR